MFYPGAFFSEEEYTKKCNTREEVINHVKRKKNVPFAIQIRKIDEFSAKREDGKSFIDKDITKDRYRIYLGGVVYNLKQLEEMSKLDPKEYKVLYQNIKGNGYERAIKTRYGNWQPLSKGDKIEH